MQRKSNTLLDLFLGIILPSIVLMQLSGEDRLGPVVALVVALAFPIGLGLYELIRHGSKNYIALLGLVSTLLTGGIGLLELDPKWLAVKEAAIPAILGIVVLVSAKIGYPLVKTFLYNPAILNTEKISGLLRDRGHTDKFEHRLSNANTLFGGTFFFSAVMNYLLATWIVTSPAGSTEFNEELGRLTLLSYPMIALPSMVMMMAILYLIMRSIKRLTGLSLEEALSPSLAPEEDKA